MPGFGNAMLNMHILLPVLGSSKQVNKKKDCTFEHKETKKIINTNLITCRSLFLSDFFLRDFTLT